MAELLTQLQQAEKMVLQLRQLRPSISAEVGTPERLIIDTVAGALSESSIDLVGLQQALNIDTKFGVNLTNFVSIFGFARRESTKATGFVVFSVSAPAVKPIIIEQGTLVKAHEATTREGLVAEYKTTAAVTLEQGKTETAPVPIEATSPGSFGNVPANTITVFASATLGPILGITGVTNPSPTTGGEDGENDNELKVRFKNTLFRNLAGTESQFLALAVSTAFSSKAVVIGPVSKYQEYVQVPGEAGTFTGDDTTSYRFGGPGSPPYTGRPTPVITRGSTIAPENKIFKVASTEGITNGWPIKIYEGGDNPEVAFEGTVESFTGTQITLSGKTTVTVEDGIALIGPPEEEAKFINKWTTALSDNPFAKHIWPELPVFISKASGLSKFFFREESDFLFNYPAKIQGDTLRAMIDGTGEDPRTLEGENKPNVTFTNVFLGSDPEAVQAVAPGSVVLLEYQYTSASSRNEPSKNVTNAVDVFVDGTNKQPSTTIFTPPVSASAQAFVDEPNSKYYYENYRRAGEPATRPLVGNILTTLFEEPVLSLPEQITVGTNKYYLGVHYWLVQDIGPFAGTIRARDGIEWSATIKADKGGAEEGRPTPKVGESFQTFFFSGNYERTYTGEEFSKLSAEPPVEVANYSFDQNIPDLQAALEAARQVTTDTLAHRSKVRYFKLDITVIYAPQATPATVNKEIREAVANFLANQYFGSVIRLSDLLRIIHNVAGVENVRWSNDVPNTRDFVRVFETDNFGEPLRGARTEREHWGLPVTKAKHKIFVQGNPTQGQFGLNYGGGLKGAKYLSNIATFTAAELKTYIEEQEVTTKVEVEEDTRSTVGVTQPIRSFTVTYEKTGARTLPFVEYNPENIVQGGEYVFDTDFFLRDDELPALPEFSLEGSEDTVPGLIIRARAQNVWEKA